MDSWRRVLEFRANAGWRDNVQGVFDAGRYLKNFRAHLIPRNRYERILSPIPALLAARLVRPPVGGLSPEDGQLFPIQRRR